MNVATSIESNAKSTEIVEPRVSPFYHPAELAQATAMFSSTPRDHWRDASITQALAMGVGVVTAIGVNDFGLAQWSATHAADRWDGIDQRQQLGDVVTVCAGQYRADRYPVGVYEDVVLRTWARAIRGVRPSFSPAPTARTDDESTAAYERSSCPDSRNRSSSNACSLFQTPAFCHASRRRQQVAPEPNPSSVGKWFQRIPVRNTNRTPLSAARSGTRGRPRRSLFRRFGFGSNGSISVRNSSSMIGACIPSVSVVWTAEVNIAPRKLTAPSQGFFELAS
ncbi:hypothetical protein R69658_07892 [Paraburkholderia aspalathi]|uniref:Nitroreductase family protein n=1 Tax=Paraburkholderia aspalathi TaxID=1324617 RepID=A0ABM8T7X6_9BURK|nr:hypothetical protein R69658_07892 [Paraburkholderia aspalathi]